MLKLVLKSSIKRYEGFLFSTQGIHSTYSSTPASLVRNTNVAEMFK